MMMMINYRAGMNSQSLTSYLAFETRDLSKDKMFFLLLKKVRLVTYEQLVPIWETEYAEKYPVHLMSARRDTLQRSFVKFCDEQGLTAHNLVVSVDTSKNSRNRSVQVLQFNPEVTPFVLELFERWLS